MTWRFKCTRTLNSVNMDIMFACVFMHGCICAHSYPKTLPQHFLRVGWHTNFMLMCFSNHLCMPGHTNQSGFCIRHSSPRQVRLTHLTWCQLCQLSLCHSKLSVPNANPSLNQSPFLCHITILALAAANGSLHKLQHRLNVIFGSLAFS